MLPAVSSSFVNRNGIPYDKVREIAYKKGELFGNLGTFVGETRYESTLFFDSTYNITEGIYIYQSYSNPFVAYKIYKSFAEHKFNGYSDDLLIQKLMEKQDKIKLTKFPHGVVTLDGCIIGQEVPYFPDSINLSTFFSQNKNIIPFKIYRAVLDILKELFDNGILYLDNNPGNFLINPNVDEVEIDLIDFEHGYIKFDDDLVLYKQQLFINLKRMIDDLNIICGIDITVGKFIITDNFEDCYSQLDHMEKTLIRK